MTTRRQFLWAAGALAAPPARAAQPKGGDPADDLPPHIRRLTWSGERADRRHDGRRFAFLNRAYGGVYEYELATGRITPCTDHFRHDDPV
jgi:hypothetical protein